MIPLLAIRNIRNKHCVNVLKSLKGTFIIVKGLTLGALVHVIHRNIQVLNIIETLVLAYEDSMVISGSSGSRSTSPKREY